MLKFSVGVQAFLVLLFLAEGLVGEPMVQDDGFALYVLTEGDDAWSGLMATPNRQGSDGLFATLERARGPMLAKHRVL